jgi:hypothetical protein
VYPLYNYYMLIKKKQVWKEKWEYESISQIPNPLKLDGGTLHVLIKDQNVLHH